MSTHTVAWRVHDNGTDPASYAVATEGSQYLIADYIKRPDHARLIAAAPQLLAAMRAILFQINQGPVLERDDCITQARAAFAAAEGGAQWAP